MNRYFYDTIFLIKFTEALSCVTGFLCLNKISSKHLKLFPFYLLIIVSVDFFIWYMKANAVAGAGKIYNYFLVPFQFVFLMAMYSKETGKSGHKMGFVFILIYALSLLIESFFYSHNNGNWLSVSYTTGVISLLVLAILYTTALLRSDLVVHYYHRTFFWINLGILLFYVGTYPYYATKNYLYTIDMGLVTVLEWMRVILTHLLYITYIIGFLCSKKIYTF